MSRGRRAERVKPANAESGPESWPTAHLSLSELRAFVRDVLIVMAENRDMTADDRGRPRARLWQIRLAGHNEPGFPRQLLGQGTRVTEGLKESAKKGCFGITSERRLVV
jgi:hypothetical protein